MGVMVVYGYLWVPWMFIGVYGSLWASGNLWVLLGSMSVYGYYI